MDQMKPRSGDGPALGSLEDATASRVAVLRAADEKLGYLKSIGADTYLR